MDPSQFTPLIVVAVVVWAVYRRVRRNFGRQSVDSGRMKFRIGIFAVVGVLLVAVAARNALLLSALLSGVVGGAVLGLIGLRHTKFEATQEGRFYTPHTYTGLLVTALFLGRMIFRLFAGYAQTPAALGANRDPLAGLQNNPVNLLVFGLLAGYYVFFYAGVLRRSQALAVSPMPPAD